MVCCPRTKAVDMCCEKLFGAQSRMVDCWDNEAVSDEMVFAVCDMMKDAYPELKETADRVSKTVHIEETRFAHTLDIGLEKLEALLEQRRVKRPGSFQALRHIRDASRFHAGCRAGQRIQFDQSGFDRAMAEQRERARASWKGAAKQTANPAYQQLPKSVFEGYLETRSEDCEVLAIIKDGQGVQELKAGEEGEVILDHTPFYAEAGGQVGDRGTFYSDELNAVVAEVKGTYYPVQGVRAHQVIVTSDSKSQPPHKTRKGGAAAEVGDKVDAVVDTGIREVHHAQSHRHASCYRPGCARCWASM